MIKTKNSNRLAPKDPSNINPISLAPAYVSLRGVLCVAFLANSCLLSEWAYTIPTSVRCFPAAIFELLTSQQCQNLVSNFKDLSFQQELKNKDFFNMLQRITIDQTYVEQFVIKF